jgi:hypothetical protein
MEEHFCRWPKSGRILEKPSHKLRCGCPISKNFKIFLSKSMDIDKKGKLFNMLTLSN